MTYGLCPCRGVLEWKPAAHVEHLPDCPNDESTPADPEPGDAEEVDLDYIEKHGGVVSLEDGTAYIVGYPALDGSTIRWVERGSD